MSAAAGNTNEDAQPTLAGRSVILRPVMPRDYELIRIAELSDQLGPRWRHRGATPAPEQHMQLVAQGALAQFMVVTLRHQKPLGLVTAYNPSFQDAHAYLAMAKFQPNDRSPTFLAGAVLFVEYVFRNWNFRKLYAETTDLNAAAFGSGIGRLLREEGRLKGHLFSNGEYVDLVVLALYRASWEERRDDFLRAVLPSADQSHPQVDGC